MYFPSSILKTRMSSTSITPLERANSKSRAPARIVAESFGPVTVPSRPTAMQRLPYGVVPRVASRSRFVWTSKISVPPSGLGIPPGIRQFQALLGITSFAGGCPVARRGAANAAAAAVNRNPRLSFFTCFPMAVEEVEDRPATRGTIARGGSMGGFLLPLIEALNRETSGDAVHLVPGLDLSDLGDLRRRGGLGIDVGAGTGEAAQSAFRSDVLNSQLPHPLRHHFDHVVVHNDSVVGHESPDTDSIVEGHQRLDTGTESSIVLLTQIVSREIGSLIHQVLHDPNVSQIGRDHQRRDAITIGGIHVLSEIDQQFHHRQPFCGSPLFVVAVDKAGSGGGHQRCLSIFRHDVRK